MKHQKHLRLTNQATAYVNCGSSPPANRAGAVFGHVVSMILILVASTPISARVFGRDDRNDIGSFLSPEQAAVFNNFGRIYCPTASAGSYVDTGFIVGADDTMVTAGHTFYPRDVTAFEANTCV